uniref:NB-ARC domain-containing protein n=1 Tax=Salix viminalis TaxID=40686 RepID=A0A6N2NGI8_SALVM
MARFLLITYALEQTLMKLGSFFFEEIYHQYRWNISVKALKEVLPSVQDLLQDTEERVAVSLLSGAFLDLQDRVDWVEYLIALGASPGYLTVKWEGMLELLNRISQSLEEIRSNRQQVESSGLGVISDDVKTVGRGDDVLKIVEFLKGSTNHQLLHVFPIVGMAGETMCSGKERRQWLSVKNRCLREIPGYEDIIIPILLKSFCHLPSSALKLCFAYCSIFSQDFTFEKEQLIQLWMAEGFLVQSDDQSEVFFNKFVDSSFVEVVEWDERGNIRSCKMNRLMHDLALHVSKLRTLNSETCSDIDGVYPFIQHANLICDVELARVYPKIAATGLVSLVTHAADVLHWPLNFDYMRTLNLDGADIKELIDSIGNLKFLKFLDLSRTCIKALPESITKLHNMQTLRLIECASLQSLPRDMRGLLSLTHIYFSYHHQMPVKVGCLISLQTLPFFVVGKGSDSTIQELESLNGLRGQLSIYNLQEVKNKKEAKKANLRGKTKIYKLEFVWRSGRKCFKNDEEVLEALQPHSNLETLKIEHYGGEKLPSWLLMEIPTHGGSLPVNNLVNLKLIDCKRCELPMLGHLPRLESLEIDGLDKVRTGFSETMPVFPALKKLSLRRMVNLVEWMVPAVSEGQSVVFPFLEELSIMSCPLLASISLKNAPSLALLEICFCEELKSLSMDSSASTALEDLTIKCCPNLESIPSAECLGSLKRLHNEGCQKFISPPIPIVQIFNSLEYLRLEGFPDLFSIPDLQNLSLKGLAIKHCPDLECIGSLQNLTSLEDLRIEVCPYLESIPSVGDLSSLKTLSIQRCHKLTSLPTGLQSCLSLENLSVQWCIELTSIPDELKELHSLVQLEITKCPSLTYFPEDSLYSLTQLKQLTIGPFSEKLEVFPGLNSIQPFHPPLEELQIHGWNRLKSLPDQLKQLTVLKSLDIGRFNKVEALPEWLDDLISLQRLRIWRCENLRSLPTSMRDLFMLKKLEIIDCHTLKKTCAEGSGPEWFKISHIPKISML